MTASEFYIPNQQIKDAAKHGELVVFVGAGASKLCGSPDWREFANQVVGALEKGSVLSFLEAEQLRGFGDPRRTLSISMALANEKGIAIDFDEILHPPKPTPIGSQLYELLSGLGAVMVTTNYDKWLDDAGPEELSTEVKLGGESVPVGGPSKRPKYHLVEHLSSARLKERGAVVHLHGSYTDQKSMVVSLKDYIRHYADKRVQEFLTEMFKDYTVLFVGYGLAELEVLDYIIRSNESIHTSSAEPRHFLLYGYRSTEVVQTKFIESFFRDQCGVNVIRYCIDAKGYQELVEVIKAFRSELDVREPTTLDLQATLDRYIALPTSENRNGAFILIGKRPELTSYFVNSLNDPVWFDELDRKGFFNVEYSPGVKVVEGEHGNLFQAEGWPALRYLEQIAGTAQGEQARRIAGIVRAISSDAQQRELDNWRTWWSLATILSQLPLEVMTDQDMEMVRSWLASRFESNMVGHELGEKLLPRLLESSEPANWHKAISLVDALSMVRRTREPS